MTTLLDYPPADAQPSPASPETELARVGRDRMEWIDGLRAVACAMVVLCHASIGMPARFDIFQTYPWSAFYSALSLPLDNHIWYFGYAGVNLFLVLSGMCLYLPLVRRPQERMTLAGFFWRRYKRLAPPCYVACILAAIFAVRVHLVTTPFAERWLLVHAAFLQLVIPQYWSQILGQTWSLALEWQCYLLFPIFVMAMKRFGPRPVVIASLLGNAIYRHWASRAIGFDGDPEYPFALISNAFGRCSEFVIGMACAQWVHDWNLSKRSPLRWYDGAFVLASLIETLWTIKHNWNFNGVARFVTFSDMAWGVLFGALIMLASRPSNRLHKILQTPAIAWFGGISYSVYLTQGHVLYFCKQVIGMEQWQPLVLLVAELSLVLAMCAAVGYVFHICFERPFMNSNTMPLEPRVKAILESLKRYQSLAAPKRTSSDT